MKTRIHWGTAGALVALVVSVVVVSSQTAFAASCGGTQGQPFLLGCNNNTATDFTQLSSSAITGLFVQDVATDAIAVQANGNYAGLYGTAQAGYGVYGSGPTGVYGVTVAATHNGVFGQATNSDGSGVYGQNDGTGNGVAGRATNANGGTGVFGELTGTGPGNGVHGKADGSNQSGMYGENLGAGAGVFGYGWATGSIGVRAGAVSGGTALKVEGKAQFSRSGTVTISYPNKQATVSGVPVTAKSLALATLQQFLAGRYVLAAVPNLSGSSNSFTIYLNKAPGTSTSPKSVVVGWQVIERP
jgi:hypothetical protein